MENENKFESKDLILFFWGWKKPIIIVTVIAAVTSIIASFIIEEKYRSTVVIFPTEVSSASKSLMSKDPEGKNDFSQIGQEEEAEQLLQILHSQKIKKKLSEKYDLYDHYDIDTTSPIKKTLLERAYKNHINFEKTEFGSIKIDVLDKNPDTAAMIANDISRLVDKVKNQIHKQRAVKGYNILKNEYNRLLGELQHIEDTLRDISKKGINDYESQSEMFNQELAIAIRNNNKNALKRLNKKIDILSNYGSAYLSFKERLNELNLQLSQLKIKLSQARVDAKTNIPHKFVVNKAFPSDKKAYPIRWLIVSSSTLGAFILTILFIMVYKKLSSLRKSIDSYKNTE